MKKLFFFFAGTFCIVSFTDAQNVGIGTTTPAHTFTVNATGIGISQESPDGLIKIGFYTNNIAAYLQTHSNHDLNFSTANGSIQMVLKTSGNFGIRNTTPNASLSVGRGTGTDGTAAFFGTANTSHFNYSTTEDTYIRAGKNNANVIINDITGGRVGIGMSNPTRAMLEQNGSVGATAAIFGGEGSGISLQKNWPAIGFNSYLDGGGHKSIGVGYGAQMGLNQNNGSLYLVSFPFNALPNSTFASFAQRFYISRFGKLGIGTDDPLSDIHIITRNYTDLDENADMGLTIEGNGNFSGYPPPLRNTKWNMHIGYGSDGTFADVRYLNFWVNGENTGWNSAARIGTDGTYYQVSDNNRKKQIHYLNSDTILNKIMQLNPVSYLMKEDAENFPLHYGFIAQDIEILFPEFVLTDSKKSKMISYSGFIPILTKGIQEQQQQIETLQNENADLKARLERLEKTIIK